MKEAILHIENSLEIQGYLFGYEYPTDGEIVFNTATVGHPESMTDPSYSGQILCFTSPLIGNYGVPDNIIVSGVSNNYDSEKIHVRGIIVSDYSFDFNHWSSSKSLDQWMKENKIPGIYGVDTRELAKLLRDSGPLLGSISPKGYIPPTQLYNPDNENQVAKVSTTEVIRYGKSGGKKVLLLDCGVKHSLLKTLINKGLEVIRVPWDYDFNTLEYYGLFISNGPGNPDFCDEAVKNIESAVSLKKPIFGVGIGNLLLAKAAGASTYKMKNGHRGNNQPVRLVGSNDCFITSQNHSYAVNIETLGNDWDPLFVNMNDGSNEGIKHKSGLFFSVNFTPDISEESYDTEFLFDNFIKLL